MTPTLSFTDEYLSAEELSTLHDILETQLQTVMKKLQAMSSDAQISQHTDPLDLAAQQTSREFTLNLVERERRLIRDTQSALARIRAGEYGACTSCGAEIGFNRLLARPTAHECIDCKTQHEVLGGRRRRF